MHRQQCSCMECGDKRNIVNNPDRRLLAWQAHQNILSQLRIKLAARTKRTPSNLLLDTNEPHRAIQHHRKVLTYAKAFCEFDKYRGNPVFWKLPTQLQKICDEPQTYFSQFSDLERNETKALEYVGVPNIITPQTKRKFASNLTKCDDYCLNRFDNYPLQLLQTHKPDIHGLFVRGQSIHLDVAQSESTTDNKHLQLDLSINDESNVPREVFEDGLQVNGKNIPSNASGTIHCYITMESSVSETKMIYLYLANHSKITLRIFLQEYEETPRFRSSRVQTETSKFFYNPNYHILPFNETVAIPIWFRCDHPGTFASELRITTDPDLWDGKLTIKVQLKSVSSDESSLNSFEEYERMIQHRVHNRHVGDLLGDIIHKVTREKSDLKLYSYDKAAIFETINTSFDLFHEHPKYKYNKQIVDELENFYDTVRLPHHPEVWSLNLGELRRVTKARENYERKNSLVDNLKNILETIERNKEMRRTALEHVQKLFHEKGARVDKDLVASGRTKVKTKTTEHRKDKKIKVDKMKEPERLTFPVTLSGHLEQIINKLESPTFMKQITSTLYDLFYSLLCAYIDKTCEEINTVFGSDALKEIAIRSKSQKLEEMSIVPLVKMTCVDKIHLFMDPLDPKGQYPQPDSVQDLSLMDYQTRFSLIQNAKTTKSKEVPKSKRKILPVKVPVPAKESETNLHIEDLLYFGKNNLKKPWHTRDLYSNNVYTTFYTNLLMCIDDFQALAATMTKRKLPHNIISILKPTIPQSDNDMEYNIEVVNLKRKISEALNWHIPEERVQPIRQHTLREEAIPAEALIISTSVWKILESYYPPRIRLVPKDEGGIFGVKPLPIKDVDEKATDITPPEILTERMVQTSLCGDINVVPPSSLIDIKTSNVCICGKDNAQLPKLISSFYNPDCVPTVESDSSGTSTTDEYD